MATIGCFLVFLVLAFTSLSADPYNIGVILVTKSESNRFDVQRIQPAINLARDTCQASFGVNLRLVDGHYYKECSETISIGKATDLVTIHNVTAFVGPACSDDLQVVGRYATYRNIPILTGLGDSVRKREEFTTLVRVSYDLRDEARAILNFMDHFDWDHFGVIYRYQDVFYENLFLELKGLSAEEGIEIVCKEHFSRAKNKTIVTDLQVIMERMKACSRVIVILGGEKDVRPMMLIAKEMGMTDSGDYAFLYPELIQSEALGTIPWESGKESEEVKQDLKIAFQALLIVTLYQPQITEYKTFADIVRARALKEYNYTYTEPVNYFTASFHDATMILCRAINQTLKAGHDPNNGTALVETMKGTDYSGVSGMVSINKFGDRVANYAILDMIDPANGRFEVVSLYFGSGDVVQEEKEIHWPANHKPVSRPYCGFDGKDPHCAEEVFPLMEVILGSLLLVLIVIALCGLLIYRRIKHEAALTNMTWRIRWEDITFTKASRSSWMMSRLSITSAMSSKMERGWVNWTPTNRDGNVLAVKKLHVQKKIELTRAVLLELKQMRESQHDNTARFIGACVDSPNVAICTEYCPKGSLQDVLHNEGLNLDWMFRYSLINDIVKGMCYLHSSVLNSHGRLRSSNCLVDSHFVLKLTDYGLPSFREEEVYCEVDFANQRKFLWKAPELLRQNHPPPLGTPKGDVYSFGIILQEIVLREEPFYPHFECMDMADVIHRVRKREDPPFRPVVEKDACIRELYNLMHRCWAENPDSRPDFNQISREMRTINRGNNIMDNLLTRMEQYANNLEQLVELRTAAFLEEKRKSEELLYQVLPKSVAEQLKRGKMVVPEMYESVTIYFSDIIGFTAMCSQSSPIQVVDFLNDLYSCFDSIICDFDVYKVETIGDAYMVVSGLPDRNGPNHAREIARLSLTLLAAVRSFSIRHRPGERLQLRIGLHTGPCCAGVVGHKMPRYCLFGDTVNTASRMESTGEPLKIHVSSKTKKLLDTFGSFNLDPRGEVEVKGKGRMNTFWLVSENVSSSKQNPSARGKVRMRE